VSLEESLTGRKRFRTVPSQACSPRGPGRTRGPAPSFQKR